MGQTRTRAPQIIVWCEILDKLANGMSFTVVPLHGLYLPSGSRIPFGSDFVLQDIPKWLRNDTGIISYQAFTDRQLFEQSRHALVAEYEADSIGQADPTWPGAHPKSIQEVNFQAAMLANMALWLRQPSAVCSTLCFHAISWKRANEPEGVPIAQQVQRQAPLTCHPNDAGNPVSPNHVVDAADIYTAIRTVPRDNPVWVAIRFFWEALTSYRHDFRYTSFWIGLEALFGPDDSGETTYKLCQRIAFFLADNPQDARNLFRKARACYNTRSKIIHGRWKHDPKINVVMADTEAIVRTALRRVLESAGMLNAFISKQRDTFLEDWVFSRNTDPPPFRER